MPSLELQTYQSCEQGWRAKLMAYGFDLAKDRGHGMLGNNIAISGRREGRKTEVNQTARHFLIVLQGEPAESIRRQQANEHEQRHESHRDQHVQQDCTDDFMEGHLAALKNLSCDNESKNCSDDGPRPGKHVEIVRERPDEPHNDDYEVQ